MNQIENIAAYIINKSIDMAKEYGDQYYCDIYKLHKLLFYAQGLFLARLSMTMFSEKIRAFDCGPLVEGVDYFLDYYGLEPMKNYFPLDEQKILYQKRETLNYTIKRYGDLSREKIVNLSRNEQVWIDARERASAHDLAPEISNSNIKWYFIELMRKSNDREFQKQLSPLHRPYI